MKDKFLCVMAQYDMETEQRLKEIAKLLKNSGFTGNKRLTYRIISLSEALIYHKKY